VEYVASISRASTRSPNDHGVVAVIDGESLKLTPFRAANIPPPMSLHDISIPSNVIDVALSEDNTSVAVLHQEGISIFDWKSVSASGSPPAYAGHFTFEGSDLAEFTYQQISFSESRDVFVLTSDGSKSLILRFGQNDGSGKIEAKTHPEVRSSSIETLSTFYENDLIHPFAQDTSGGIHSLVFGEYGLAHLSFPTAMPWVEIISNGESQMAFGMSGNGRLYANSRLIVKNCTSYLVTDAHLIFTTTTHLIKFVHITNINEIIGKLPLSNCPNILTLSRSRYSTR
jgi:elongator complex protein 1